MSDKLRYHCDQIAMESLTEGGMTNIMRMYVPGLFASLKSTLSEIYPPNKAVQFSREHRKFLEMIEKQSYYDLQPLSVFVPEGMVASYVDYLASLTEAVKHCHGQLQETLSKYAAYLGGLVNSRDNQLSMKSDVFAYKLIEKDRNILAKAMEKCFDHSSHKSEQKYGDVIKRNGDWSTVLKDITVVGDQVNTIDRQAIVKKAATIVELMDVILKRSAADEYVDISSEMVQTLSEGSYQVAKEIEFYSVVHYRALALATAITDSVKKLNDILNK